MAIGSSTNRTIIVCDLREALARPGCPICRLNATAAERYADGLLWEHVNDPRVRKEIRCAKGFCSEHGAKLVRPG